MTKVQVDEWRGGVESRLEELTVMSAKQNSDIEYIKETTSEIKDLLKQQNGRVRSLEQKTSALEAIGASVSVIFGGLMGWLFNTKG